MATSVPFTLAAATPTLIATGLSASVGVRFTSVKVSNLAAAAMFFGGSNVSNANGYSLGATTNDSFQLAPGESLYAYSVLGGSLNVLTSGI